MKKIFCRRKTTVSFGISKEKDSYFFLFFFFFLFFIPSFASKTVHAVFEKKDTIPIGILDINHVAFVDSFDIHKGTEKQKNKLIAAILSFPFPFGFFGIHRIYLGANPAISLVYIATLGGCFGILPFIDFIVIIIDDDMERYQKNSKVFMWNNK